MSSRPAPLTFRPFAATDADRLGRWLAAAGMGAPPWISVDTWARRLIADPRISCRAACLADRTLGYCRLDVAPDRSAEVTLVVGERHRRRGVGRALLEDALEQARAGQLRRLIALVQPQNRAGLGFFRDAAFERAGPDIPGFVQLVRIVHRSHRMPPLEISP